MVEEVLLPPLPPAALGRLNHQNTPQEAEEGLRAGVAGGKLQDHGLPLGHEVGQVLDGKGQGQEGSLVEQHADLPEINGLDIRPGREGGVELLGSEVGDVGAAGIEAEHGAEGDGLPEDYLAGRERAAGVERAADEGDQFVEDADDVQLGDRPLLGQQLLQRLLVARVGRDDLVELRGLHCEQDLLVVVLQPVVLERAPQDLALLVLAARDLAHEEVLAGLLVLEAEGLVVEGLAGVVELVEDEAAAAADVEQLGVLVVAVVDCPPDLHHEVAVAHLQRAEAVPLAPLLPRLPPSEHSLPEPPQLRLLRREVLQRLLLLQRHQQRRGVAEDLFADLEEVLDDADGVAGLEPQVLLGAVQHELVGEGGERDLPQRVHRQRPPEVPAVQQVEAQRADRQRQLVPLLRAGKRVD